MKLIEAGNYNFTYNQEYLLTKLWAIDVYNALFWGFWLSIFLAFLVYWVIRYFKSDTEHKIELKIMKREERLIADRKEIFIEFHEICRLIHEDLNVFKRPESMVEQMYYPRLKDVLFEMGKHREFMKKNYMHLIPDYEFYRKKLIDAEKL